MDPQIVVSQLTDEDVIARLTTAQVIACTLYGEARGGSSTGRHAVASVIGNRAKRPKRFGHGLRGVCLQPWQFSCWTPKGGAANYRAVLDVARTLLKQGPIGPAMRECLAIATELEAGVLEDIVCGATHYLTEALFKTDPPAWAKGKTTVSSIEGHAFFNGID